MSPRVRASVRTTPVAVIDIGTNSVKLLVAHVRGRRIHPLHFDRATTRLGANLVRVHRIDPAAEARTTRAVTRFIAVARGLGAADIVAVGTHALRAAANGRDVALRISRTTGVPVRVLSGRDEALAAFRSARMRLPRRTRTTVMLDVGGGSAEVVVAEHERILYARALPLGALHLTRTHITSDPVNPSEYAALTRDVTTRLARAWKHVPGPASDITLVVSGGSATTALDMAFRGAAHTGKRTLSRTDLERLERECLARTTAQRMRLPGLPPDRADIIPAGIAVVLTLLRISGKRSLAVNEGGLREGVLLGYFT